MSFRHADEDDDSTDQLTTPEEAADEDDVCHWRPDERRYTRVSPDGSDGTAVTYVHHLAACVHTDPHRVFAEETQVHHDSHAFLNLPEYVDVVERDHHHRLHRGEAFALDERAIPVRREAGEVPAEERVEIDDPDNLERWAMGPRSDSPVHDDETEDSGA